MALKIYAYFRGIGEATAGFRRIELLDREDMSIYFLIDEVCFLIRN